MPEESKAADLEVGVKVVSVPTAAAVQKSLAQEARQLSPLRLHPTASVKAAEPHWEIGPAGTAALTRMN